MATLAVWLKLDEDEFVRDLQQACEKLHGANGQVVLDLSSVQRVSPAAVAALEKFAARADEKGVRIVLRGASVQVYKVLKLMKLSQRFSFTT